MNHITVTDRVGTGGSFSGSRSMAAEWVRQEYSKLGEDWDEVRVVAERVASRMESGGSIDSGDLEFLGMDVRER